MIVLRPVLRRITEPPGAHRLSAPLLSRPVAPLLQLLLVVEREDRRIFVTEAQQHAWGLPVVELWRRAVENLVPTAVEGLTVVSQHVRFAPDAVGAGRLALPGWLRSFEGQVPGAPCVLAPTADQLWVVGREDPDLPALLEEAFVRFREGARPLSPAPIGPVCSPKNLRLLEAFVYAEQGEILLETGPEGVFVAPLSLRLTGDSAVTRTELRRGLRCWLPKADEVVVDGEVLPFAAVPATPVGLQPERYEPIGSLAP